MIILGIDPGSRKCGYGVLHTEKNKILAAGHGIIMLEKMTRLEDKLLLLDNELSKIISEYKPEQSVVESIFYGKNIQTAFLLGHVRGVIIHCLAKHKIPVFSYSPREIKQSVTGRGNASKLQVEFMIQSILNLSIPAKEDSADGLACAMCLFNKMRF